MPGRWPANVILSPEMAEVLDKQTGDLSVNGPAVYKRSKADAKRERSAYTIDHEAGEERSGYGDSGGASRFFLNAGYTEAELEWIYSVGLRPYGME